MLKNALTTAVLMVAATTLALAGTVNILPMKPKQGGEITIEYKAGEGDQAWIDRVGSVSAVVFGFESLEDAPTAYDVALKYDGKRHTGTMQLPDNVVFGMIKVGDGLQYDNNGEVFWDFIVYAENGRAAKDAHLRAALSWLGGLPDECQRKQDQQAAMDHMSKELMNWPKNLPAQVNNTFLMASAGMIVESEVPARIREIVGDRNDFANTNEAMAIAQAYRAIGDVERSTSIMKKAEMRYPNSKIAEQLALENLSKAPDLETFVNLVADHLNKYPNSFAKTNLIDYVINNTTRSRNLKPLVTFLDKTDNVAAKTYYEIVNYLGTQ